MSAPQPLLVGRQLAKRYRQRQVLSGVDIEIGRGESVVLLGPNGAGKTTCFYILAGLIRPSGGTISFAGKDITNLSIDQRAALGLGLLPQERSVFSTLSVLDNLRAVLEISNPRNEDINERAWGLLREMRIDKLARQMTSALSGGEIRRLEIARALVLRPQVLLLDEPFAAIDPLTVSDLREVLAKLRRDGISVVISDHNVRETLASGDRGYILLDGEVLCAGTPAELAANELVRKHYLGEDFRL